MLAGSGGPLWYPCSGLDGATQGDSCPAHRGLGWLGCHGGENASPLQLVWIQTAAGPALLATPSHSALTLRPGSQDLLVQIGAKSPASLGMGLTQGVFLVKPSASLSSGHHHRAPLPFAADPAILPGKRSKIKAARVPRRGRSESARHGYNPPQQLPAWGLPRCGSDGEPGTVTWGRQCCSSPGRCAGAGHLLFSSGERISI